MPSAVWSTHPAGVTEHFLKSDLPVIKRTDENV